MNVSPETIKFLEEHLGDDHIDLNLRDIFVNLTSKARGTKAKISKWDYIRLKKKLLYSQENIIKMKMQSPE